MASLRRKPPENPLMGLYFEEETRRRLAGKTMILGFGARFAGVERLNAGLAASDDVHSGRVKEWNFFNAWLRPDLSTDAERLMTAREQKATERKPGGGLAKAFAARRAALTRPEAWLDFLAAGAGEKKALLDISPDYAALSADDLGVIAAYFAAAGVKLRPLLVIRDPVDRLLAEAMARPGDPLRAFRKALADPDALSRSRYEVTLTALWSAFPRENVTVLFRDDFNSDEELLTEAAGRLGIVPPAAELPAPAGPLPVIPQGIVAKATENFEATYSFIAREFSGQIPHNWRLSAA